MILLLVVNPWIFNLRQEFALGNIFSNFETIFKTIPEDVQQINLRRSYYSNQILGKIFENKPLFYLDKYENNFFQGLDLNYYFFANHPRERAGVAEKEIFFWVWLPVFLIGLFSSLRKSVLFPNLIFLAILSVVSFFTRIDNFVIVLIPFLAVNLYSGWKILLE